MLNYKRITTRKPDDIEKRNAYLVGGGIASLAAAAYLIKDGHMPGKNIHILEKTNFNGGSLDGNGSAEKGYLTRGGREFEEHYECTWDLFGMVPSLNDKNRTVLDEIADFNKAHHGRSKCRLVENSKKVDFSTLGLSLRHVNQLSELFMTPEQMLDNVTVEQWFDSSFFDTNFWLFWRTMFAFQVWHSVAEMRRYMVRFIHLMPTMNTLEGILRTPYNQYDSMILPLQEWLKSMGVDFVLNTKVLDMEIKKVNGEDVATKLYVNKNGKDEIINLSDKDLVFITNGSMVENATIGSMKSAPVLNKSEGDIWKLWKNIAKRDSKFGNPQAFTKDIDKSKWESFTVTFKGTKFIDKLEEFTGNKSGTGGLVTFKNSNWLLSIVAFEQPHFINQPKDVSVIWGYSLFGDNKGDYIKKPMAECSGEEILREVCYHLGFIDDMDEIVASANVIPAMMPYITSQFMPRRVGDRPKVVPDGVKNFAFLGQFAEVPNECVFTVEYSVKSAMIAVYKLLQLDKEPPETYQGMYDSRVVAAATKKLLEDNQKLVGGFLKQFIG